METFFILIKIQVISVSFFRGKIHLKVGELLLLVRTLAWN
jgi:hypothetical protein